MPLPILHPCHIVTPGLSVWVGAVPYSSLYLRVSLGLTELSVKGLEFISRTLTTRPHSHPGCPVTPPFVFPLATSCSHSASHWPVCSTVLGELIHALGLTLVALSHLHLQLWGLSDLHCVAQDLKAIFNYSLSFVPHLISYRSLTSPPGIWVGAPAPLKTLRCLPVNKYLYFEENSTNSNILGSALILARQMPSCGS